MMGKKQWKTIAISVATLLLLSLLVCNRQETHHRCEAVLQGERGTQGPSEEDSGD